MMIRLKCLVTVYAACLAMTCSPQEGVESLLTGSTQNPSESSQADSADVANGERTDAAEEEERIKAEVADIMAIRKQLGGGVSEQLKGFSVEMPNGKEGKTRIPEGKDGIAALENSFAEQLAARSRNSQGENKTLSAVKQLIRLENQKYESVSAKAKNAAGGTVEPIALEPAMPSRERRETIRNAARMLEEAAAILEEAEEFNQADKIRLAASELWRTARKQ